MFNPITAHIEASEAIRALDPGVLDVLASKDQLQSRADYIHKLLRIVGDLAEVMAKDANGSINSGRVDFEDAGYIRDLGSDFAGQIERAFQ